MNPLELQLTFDQEFDKLMDVFVLVSQFAKARADVKKLQAQEFQAAENYQRALSRYESTLTRQAIVVGHFDRSQARLAIVKRLQGLGQHELFQYNAGRTTQNYDMRYKGNREYFNKGAISIKAGGTVMVEGQKLQSHNLERIYDRVAKKVAWLESNPEVNVWLKHGRVSEAIEGQAEKQNQMAFTNKLDTMVKRLDNVIDKDTQALTELDGIVHRQAGNLMSMDGKLTEVRMSLDRMPQVIKTAKKRATLMMLRNLMRGFN